MKLKDYLSKDYYRVILPYVKNRDVLDVGCVGHDYRMANKERFWSHWFLNQVSKNLVGIDIVKVSIKQMSSEGFKVTEMDAEKISFRRKFDVVFAGELIEHLPNPGIFLKKSALVLKQNGIILLTTPNTYSISRLVRVFVGRTNEPPVNPDHTFYLTPEVIRGLAGKSGLRVVKISYAHYPFIKDGLLVKLNELLCKIAGEKFKEQIIVLLKR